ncbi:MAG: hypothetical protein JXB62_02285 [Pirellulales bacterium]|nr:hypothetical protein [Pirellulales bacterium]
MKSWITAVAVLGVLVGAGQANGAILVGAEAVAFQDEGTTALNVASGVSTLDGVWSLTDVYPFGTVVYDYYATGTSPAWFDALSLEFAPGAYEDLSNMTFRAYLQKGAYGNNSWQHYQILPGKLNSTNQDLSPAAAPGAIQHPTALARDEVVGWVEFDVDATSDPAYLLSNGNVALTFRLWNWRIDAVELSGDIIPEPATIVIWSLLGALGAVVCWRRRRAA